jgi:hypothetical protein
LETTQRGYEDHHPNMSKITVVALGFIALTITLHITRPAEPTTSDCEAVGTGLVRQPGNTASALVLVAAGIAVASTGRTARAFGSAVASAGGASALFHATNHPIAGHLDLITAVGAVLAALHYIATHRPPIVRTVTAAALAALGLVIWSQSRTGETWCDPELVFGGHAIWHLLLAAATLAVAQSRTNRGTSPPP